MKLNQWVNALNSSINLNCVRNMKKSPQRDILHVYIHTFVLKICEFTFHMLKAMFTYGLSTHPHLFIHFKVFRLFSNIFCEIDLQCALFVIICCTNTKIKYVFIWVWTLFQKTTVFSSQFQIFSLSIRLTSYFLLFDEILMNNIDCWNTNRE